MVRFVASEAVSERLCDTYACRYRAARWWWPRFIQLERRRVIVKSNAAAASARRDFEVKQYIGLCRGRDVVSKMMDVACGHRLRHRGPSSGPSALYSCDEADIRIFPRYSC